MSLFETYWTEALRGLLPWAASFFSAITVLGSANFYVALVAIGYWAVDKRFSRRTAILLLVSSFTNYWLKVSLRNPRPPPTNWLPGTEASNYSLPSGHAQTSMTIWGWLGLKIGELWMWGLSTALVLLIGLSRVYIGVHWLGDILLGWVIGAVLLLAASRLEDWASSLTSRYGVDTLYLVLIAMGVVSMVLTEALFPVNLVGMKDNFGSNGGFMVGLGVGLMLERRFVKFDETPKTEKWRAALRVILGLGLVVAVLFGLASVFPSEVYVLRATRYALSSITALFIWPFIFTRLNL